MSWVEKAIVATLVIMLAAVAFLSDSLSDARRERDSFASQLTEQVAINKDYKSRIQSLHELDTMYTQELTNAKTEIDSLRDAVKSGAKRVYVRAECPKSGTDTATGMDDATTVRLARDAEPDYFHLRKQLETMDAQLRGLQGYIKTQCLAK